MFPPAAKPTFHKDVVTKSDKELKFRPMTFTRRRLRALGNFIDGDAESDDTLASFVAAAGTYQTTPSGERLLWLLMERNSRHVQQEAAHYSRTAFCSVRRAANHRPYPTASPWGVILRVRAGYRLQALYMQMAKSERHGIRRAGTTGWGGERRMKRREREEEGGEEETKGGVL